MLTTVLLAYPVEDIDRLVSGILGSHLKYYQGIVQATTPE